MLRTSFTTLKAKFGFTLVELLTVVVIIAVLAAIAIPSYLKYVRGARTSEALSNLAAMQTFEESYFAENDSYVTAGANPATFPTGGERESFDPTAAGWTDLGRVMPAREVFFQYQITAGRASGSTVFTPTTISHGAATGCTQIGNSANFSGVTPASLGIPDIANTFWFVVSAIADQDGDGDCSLFIAVTDRPDITEEAKIE